MGRMKLLLRTSHLLLVVVATILSSSVLGSFLNDPKDEASSSSPGSVILPGRVRQISWKPRAFIYSGFLTDEECDHLISLAKSELRRSAVADNVSGETKLSDGRTSSGMFISKGKVCPCNKLYVSEVECRSGMGSLNLFFLPERVSDPIVSGIEGKIAAWTFLPKENGEDIQVLRYEHGQKYDPHYDYFSDKVNIARGGHRIATVLMYLTDVEKGGETVFPSAEVNDRRRGHIVDDGLSDCAKKGIAVKPKKGDALLFFSLHPNVVPDERSLHAGCPVIEGEKWSATKWIHVASFDKSVGGSSGCVDENEYCERWAALGECTNNPDYMVGSPEAPGACRRSCEVC